MLVQFYSAFAPISFTVLGLWFIVVQTRHADWAASPHHRRTASIVALQFGLPGLMSLLSLVAPTSHVLWRVSFCIASLVGAAALLALSFGPAGGPRLAGVGRWLSVALFVLVAAVALAPGLPGDLGLHAAGALGVEATLLSLLVFVGLAIAWLLLFTGVAPAAAAPPPQAAPEP